MTSCGFTGLSVSNYLLALLVVASHVPYKHDSFDLLKLTLGKKAS